MLRAARPYAHWPTLRCPANGPGCESSRRGRVRFGVAPRRRADERIDGHSVNAATADASARLSARSRPGLGRRSRRRQRRRAHVNERVFPAVAVPMPAWCRAKQASPSSRRLVGPITAGTLAAVALSRKAKPNRAAETSANMGCPSGGGRRMRNMIRRTWSVPRWRLGWRAHDRGPRSTDPTDRNARCGGSLVWQPPSSIDGHSCRTPANSRGCQAVTTASGFDVVPRNSVEELT